MVSLAFEPIKKNPPSRDSFPGQDGVLHGFRSGDVQTCENPWGRGGAAMFFCFFGSSLNISGAHKKAYAHDGHCHGEDYDKPVQTKPLYKNEYVMSMPNTGFLIFRVMILKTLQDIDDPSSTLNHRAQLWVVRFKSMLSIVIRDCQDCWHMVCTQRIPYQCEQSMQPHLAFE